MGIANYTAIAAKIQPDVEKHIGAIANLNTIVVAIKRYADSFEHVDKSIKENVLRNTRLSLTDGMMGVSFTAHDFSGNPFKILDKFSDITNDYEFFRLADTFSVITENIAAAREFFENIAEQSKRSVGLAKIKISKADTQNKSDIVSYIIEILHNGGIEIVNTFFGHNNVTIILKEQDASRAYEILRTYASY